MDRVQFIEQRRLIMDWWSNYLDANRGGHVSPYDFANATGRMDVKSRVSRESSEKDNRG